MQADTEPPHEKEAAHSSKEPMMRLHLTGRGYIVLLLFLLAPWGLLAAMWMAKDLSEVFKVSTKVETNRRVTYAAQGPWGALRCTRITIEPPEEAVFVRPEDETPTRWCFTGFTLDKLRELFAAVGFEKEQVTFLIERSSVDTATGMLVVTPTPEFVLGMATETRRQLYRVLATFAENPLQRVAVTLQPEYLDECLSDREIPPAIILDLKRMLYPYENTLLFADTNILLPRLTDAADKIRFIRMLARKNTLLVDLEVNANSELEELINYWAVGGRAKDIRPLLESLQRTPGGASVDITHLLPHFARERLYTFPYSSGPKIEASRDCHWSSLNFFNATSDDRYADPALAYDTIRNSYYAISTGSRLGDLVLLVTPQNQLVHSAVYVAGGIVFTKNGAKAAHPWMLMKMTDMQALFEGAFQGQGPLRVMYYRKRAE